VSDKDTLNAYRDAAARLVSDLRVADEREACPDIRVNRIGSVHPSEDGAFVELLMWVPKTALEQGK
jgi:hypothetical protein